MGSGFHLRRRESRSSRRAEQWSQSWLLPIRRVHRAQARSYIVAGVGGSGVGDSGYSGRLLGFVGGAVYEVAEFLVGEADPEEDEAEDDEGSDAVFGFFDVVDEDTGNTEREQD